VDDSALDIWAEVQSGLAEAVGVALDAAVFSGVNKPATWPTAIVPAAIAAGNTTEAGTSTPAEGGILGDVAAALDFVEGDGYSPARKRWRSWLARPSTSTSGTKPRPVYLKVSEGL